MKRLRILMLGWEFPPLVHGGLGVACVGLSHALATQVDLTLVIPSGSRQEGDLRFQQLGLECLTAGEIRRRAKPAGDPSSVRIYQVPISLDPYSADCRMSEVTSEKVALGDEPVFPKIPPQPADSLSNCELYGSDLERKVAEFSAEVAKIALSETFDLIHAHDWMTFLAGVRLKRMTGRPLVVHVHSLLYDRAGAQARGWIDDLEKHGLDQADRIISVSRYTRDILVHHYGIHPAKVRPVHNGVEPVRAFSTKRPFPEKQVLFLGRLTAQKGPEFFLEIASRVIEKRSDVRFVVAGTGEKHLSLLENCQLRGLSSYFHFTGFLSREKVHHLLSMTDVYCMPSVSEPFGLSALEAVQFDIPSVISKQSGVAEVLQGALKANYWEVDQMAKQILDLLGDEELRVQVIEQSRVDLLAATWELAAEQIVEIYQELMGRR